MTMADKIVVLQAGRIEQVGSPLDLYNRPDNLFVAGFIGSPRMNFVSGEEARRHGAATIGIRPEHIAIGGEGGWSGVVGLTEHLGSDTFFRIDCGALGVLTVRAPGDAAPKAGDRVALAPDPSRIHRFDAEGKAIR